MPIPFSALSYTALNLHTANRSSKSLCGIGIYVVENRKRVLLKYILIKPNTTSFNYEKYGYFQKDAVLCAPSLGKVWPDLLPYIENRNIAVYNLEQTLGILRDSLKACGIDFPNFNAVDVRDMFDEKQLLGHTHSSLASKCKYEDEDDDDGEQLPDYSYASLASVCGYDDEFENGNVYENLKLYRACIEYGARHDNITLIKAFGLESASSFNVPFDEPIFTIYSDVNSGKGGCCGCAVCIPLIAFMLFIIAMVIK